MATRYPAGQYGRCSLELFFFPGIYARQLFLESFAGDRPSTVETRLNADAGTWVGLLKQDD